MTSICWKGVVLFESSTGKSDSARLERENPDHTEKSPRFKDSYNSGKVCWKKNYEAITHSLSCEILLWVGKALNVCIFFCGTV